MSRSDKGSSLNRVVLGVGAGLLALFVVRAMRGKSDDSSVGDGTTPAANQAASSTSATPGGGTSVDSISEATLASLRELAVTAEGSYRGRLEYAVKEKELLDPMIRELLASWGVRDVPADEPKRGQFLHALRSAYAASQKTPAWLSAIEQLVERRFAAPSVREQGDAVEVDYGQLPGKLTVRGKKGIVIESSPHLQAGQWKSEEVAKALADAAASHPRAKRIRVLVQIEDQTYPREWVYEYERASDVVMVSFPARPNELYTSPRLGGRFDVYLRGDKSLNVAALTAGNRAAFQR
ncbi:MAG: hypothetical protein JNJ46_16930 [Myxococcales bacterium]|nr:hypothetical protein [Myxococcales bacterium]